MALHSEIVDVFVHVEVTRRLYSTTAKCATQRRENRAHFHRLERDRHETSVECCRW